MPKKITTKKTTKLNRTAKTKATKATKATRTAKVRVTQSEPGLLARVQTEPIEVVKDVASKSLHLGLGLGAFLFDTPQDIRLGSLRGNLRQNLNSIVDKAIIKGEKIEREQRSWLTNFERDQRKRVKSFLDARRRDIRRTETTIEEKIEEVIASLDIPTRNDIHQLNRRVNELQKELARHRQQARKQNRAAKAEPVATEAVSQA